MVSLEQFLELQACIEDPHILSVKCLLEMGLVDFKQIVGKAMYLAQTRSSASVCRIQKGVPILREVAQTSLPWTAVDAHCLLEDPSLSQPLLPQIFATYTPWSHTPDRLDRVLHLLATLIMVLRLEPRFELRKPIFRAVKEQFNRNLRQLSSRKWDNLEPFSSQHWENLEQPSSRQWRFDILCSATVSYLRSLASSGLRRSYGFTKEDARQSLAQSLLEIWTLIEADHGPVYQNIRQNLLLILVQTAGMQDLEGLLPKLARLFSGGCSLQERVVCLFIEAFEPMHAELRLCCYKLIEDYLGACKIQRPFRCKRHGGLPSLVPFPLDQKILLRRFTVKGASAFIAQKTFQFIGDCASTNFDMEALRIELGRRLCDTVNRSMLEVARSNKIVELPVVIPRIEASSQASEQFWNLLILTSSLRMRLPFTIDPQTARAAISGDSREIRSLYARLADVQLGSNARLRHVYNRILVMHKELRRVKGRPALSLSMSASSFFDQSDKIRLSPTIGCSADHVAQVVNAYFPHWRQSFLTLNFSSRDDLSKFPEHVTAFIVNPSCS